MLARQADTGICLMHMQGLPENMQINPKYQDVVGEVAWYLKERAAECIAAGIAPQRITLDPGFGFGKNLQHNIALMRHLPELMAETGFPLLIGVSRKRVTSINLMVRSSTPFAESITIKQLSTAVKVR